MMRLDKLLADCTALTRSQAGKAIRDGRVQVDGCTVTSPDRKIDELSVKVMLDGQYCGYQAFHYYILDKPKGILTASRDRKQKTVMDLFPPEIRRHPPGRLNCWKCLMRMAPLTATVSGAPRMRGRVKW